MQIDNLIVDGVRSLKPYLPGKPISELERELGISQIIKLASNENPLGPSPRALKAARESLEEIHLYPDGGGFELRAALADHYGLSMEQITLGNGSNDVLELIARAFLSHGTEAVYSEHAFAVYPIVTQATGAKGVVVPAHNGSRGPKTSHDLDGFLKAITPATRVVFIANPNNPTGTYLNSRTLEQFLCQVPAHVMVVIDEAYVEYVEKPDYQQALPWLVDYPNLIVTRTFSKAFGLAGLRVGFAASSSTIQDVLNRVRQPFNVNLPALAAACAALKDHEHIQKTVALNTAGMAYYEEAFKGRQLEYIPSVGNFITLNLGRPAGAVYEALLKQGIIVRPIANYGLPQHLRITIGTAEQNAKFLAALDRILYL